MIQKKQSKYYHLRVFGCQMNKSDAERIDSVMQKAEYSPTTDEKQADVIIAVMCSVRQSAVDRIYGLSERWRKLKIKNLKFKIILTGCVLEFDRRRLAERFDYIIPIEEIGRLPKIVISNQKAGVSIPGRIRVQMSDNGGGRNARTNAVGAKTKVKPLNNVRYGARKDFRTNKYLETSPLRQGKFQAWVPIMTGCDNYCTYCVVPYVRGEEISRPAKEVVNELSVLVKRGYKEITLLGENVNNYSFIKTLKHFPLRGITLWVKNIKTTTTDFPALLKTLAKIPGDFWIRFVTSNPENFSDELIRVVANEPKICNHIHLPVQSGSDAILKKMNRKYTKDEYLKLIKKIKKAIPDVALSTDVIVGFPGETTDDFNETARLMREVKFDMAYIAQYSPRSGTAAFRMTDDVTREEKKRRERVLTDVLKRTALANNRRLVGKTVGVLVENEANKVNTIVNTVVNKSELGLSENKLNKAEPRARHSKINKLLLGKTEGFKNVRFSEDDDLMGRFVKVKITGATAWGLTGELIINNCNL